MLRPLRFRGLLHEAVLLAAVLLPPLASGLFGFDLFDAGENGTDAMLQRIHPSSYEEFTTRRCGRATAVLFLGSRNSKASAEVLTQFKLVAADFKNQACFGVMHCQEHPYFCNEQNVRKPPTVVMYPGQPGAPAHPILGKLDKNRIEAVVTSIIKKNAKPVMTVDKRTCEAFLRDHVNPFKVIFFSQQKAPPVIVWAMSGDPELIHIAEYGFVPNSDMSTMAHFGVKKAPQVFVQYMDDATTRKVYPIDGSAVEFLPLRQWIRDSVHSLALSTTEYRIKTGFLPWEGISHEEVAARILQGSVTEGMKLYVRRAAPVYADVGAWGDVSRLVAPGDSVVAAGVCATSHGMAWVPIQPSGYVEVGALSKEQAEEKVSKPEYQQMPYGAKECPPGLGIETAEECEAAIMSLGLVAQPAWVSNFPGLPSHCSVREKVGASSPERMHFNSAQNGAGREDLAPVCRTAASTGTENDPAALAAEAAEAAAAARGQRLAAKGTGGGGMTAAPTRAVVPPQRIGAFGVKGSTAVKLTAAELAEHPGSKVIPATPRSSRAAGESRPADSVGTGKSPSKPAKSVRTQATSESEGNAKQHSSRVQSRTPRSPRQQRYKLMPYGTPECPHGLEIRSVAECEKAILSLGLDSRPAWVSAYPGVPSLCSVRESPTEESPERMHFNSAAKGAGRDDLAPVCLAEPADADASDGGGGVNPGAMLLPELTGVTKHDLLPGDGYCVVYLCEGPISLEEALMLRVLQQRTSERSKEVGWDVRWMWLDVRAERKLKAVFDPPVFPSAIVLNPDWRRDADAPRAPMFASLVHREEDGDPLPADSGSIEMLLLTVLGDDAKFKPITAKRLMHLWSARQP